MTYGVLASKPAQVQVDQVDRGAPGSAAEPSPRTRHAPAQGSPWSDGRITLTSRHLSFIPVGSHHGVPALTLSLSDVLHAEAGGSRFRKAVTIVTPDVVLRSRVSGAGAFARQITSAAHNARKRRDEEARLFGEDDPDDLADLADRGD